jgi:hypothetical protein
MVRQHQYIKTLSGVYAHLLSETNFVNDWHCKHPSPHFPSLQPLLALMGYALAANLVMASVVVW